MSKKNNNSYSLISILLIIIIAFSFGVLVRQELVGSKKMGIISKTALNIAEIPMKLFKIYENINKKEKDMSIKDPNRKPFGKSARHYNKKKNFSFYKNHISNRNELLMISRFDNNIRRSVVEIIDLNNFNILHSFKSNISEIINENVNLKKAEFIKNIGRNQSEDYFFSNPLINKDGSLVFNSSSPLIKVNFCGDLIWINDTDNFHRSVNIDHEGNYWVPSQIYPHSIDKELVGDYWGNYRDDAITKISEDGKILLQKSVSQILIDNGYKYLIFAQRNYPSDAIHLNDIEPALENGPYWEKGDLFLSLRNLSMIIHYRPSKDKIINILKGKFFNQYDVDIINNREISIFNNNVFFTHVPEERPNAERRRIITNSEILIYNFENKKYSKKFQKAMRTNNIKSEYQGLVEILDDGSMLIEEQGHGRLVFIDKNEDLEWEYINKANDGNIYYLHWSRIINDQATINFIRNNKNKDNCIN